MPRSHVSFADFTWRAVRAHVTIVRNYRVEGWTHLCITLKQSAGPPLPFIVDGHIAHHGVEQEQLNAAGGVLRYLQAWADREASSPAYLNAVAKWRQGDLFKAARS
jgi:hypothetical protein